VASRSLGSEGQKNSNGSTETVTLSFIPIDMDLRIPDTSSFMGLNIVENYTMVPALHTTTYNPD
jgi:hypothetical protein